MITYSDIQRYDNLPFAEYLRMNKEAKAYSFSFMKAERFGQTEEMEITEAMRRGSLVDAILTEPASVNYNDILYPQAKVIAGKIKDYFGAFLSILDKQVSFTAELEHKGFKIKSTGRLDFLLRKYAVIDLKVTNSKDVRGIIHFMNYKEQVWHYANLAGVKKAYILIYSVPNKKAELIRIPIPERSEFWESKVLKFGVYEK